MTKIIVVEDQLVLATVYRNKFLAEGYEVEIAPDGEQALELINSAKPDLVILDLMLPKLNGIEVLRRVRANQMFKNLPVIVFSNASLPKMVEEAWKTGATMVLSKSNHSPNEIVESVRTALKAAAANAPTPPPEELIASESRTTSGKVLLVEDHADMSALISYLLERSGHHVTIVASHADALREDKDREYDLYLINHECPDGAGLDLCRELRLLYPEHPIVMYSTAASAEEQQAALDGGASVYVTEARELLDVGNVLSSLMKELKVVVGVAGQPSASVSPVAA